MSEPILVTGATGNVGTEVIKLLQNSGRSIRAAVRDVEQARSCLGAKIDYVPFDFEKPETFATALKDVRKLFLVRPPQIERVRKYIYPMIAQAHSAKVEHIVFLSLLGVEKQPWLPHRRIERYIESLGIPWTFLRASFFMQNLNTIHLPEIRERNEIFIPAGKGKTSFIDVRDIAAVAVQALTTSAHVNQAYDLTGGYALDYYQVADMFTLVLSRKIVYSNPSILSFARRMYARGFSTDSIVVMLGIYGVVRLGRANRVTPNTERLLGRAPITFSTYIEDYKPCWVASS